MKYFPIILLGLSLLFFSSCEKKTTTPAPVTPSNSLVFGTFYGECMGEYCVLTYKLTETAVYEDTKKEYRGTTFSFVQMENDKFQEVDGLFTEFPTELLLETEETIGCPDCMDQGGVFIQLTQSGTVKRWYVDNNKSAIPGYLHAFIDLVHEKVDLIKD